MFDLARRVAKGDGKDRKFGFSFNRWSGDPFNDSQNYAAPLQLKMFDNKGEKMTVDTPQWAKVWKDVLALYTDKIVPSQTDMNVMYDGMAQGKEAAFNPFQGDLFINGRIAMMIGGYDYT